MVTAETTPLDAQRQTTLDLLTALTPQWLDLRYRYEDRSASLDSKLGAEYKDVNAHMNHLLEDYFVLTAGVVCDAV